MLSGSFKKLTLEVGSSKLHFQSVHSLAQAEKVIGLCKGGSRSMDVKIPRA